MQIFFSKFHRESVQKSKTGFKIAYLLALNFQNNFKPNDGRKMLISKNADL
jgi:hypothetical protein